MLILLNSAEAPKRDQDLIDFLSEFYIFITFYGQSGEIRTEKELLEQFASLKESGKD